MPAGLRIGGLLGYVIGDDDGDGNDWDWNDEDWDDVADDVDDIADDVDELTEGFEDFRQDAGERVDELAEQREERLDEAGERLDEAAGDRQERREETADQFQQRREERADAPEERADQRQAAAQNRDKKRNELRDQHQRHQAKQVQDQLRQRKGLPETGDDRAARQRVAALGDGSTNVAGLAPASVQRRAGERDGLFWASAPGDPASPFGPFIAEISALLAGKERGDPYRGYYYRVLKRQTEHAAGGAYNCVINGKMIAGFGLLAWPAEYGQTGVMTFQVSHQGDVFEADFGAETAEVAATIDAYDPDPSWTEVTD